MKRAVLLCLLLAAAGCQKNEPTPRGTELLSWTSARASRRSVAAAKEVGPRTVKDVNILVKPERKGALRLAVHVESAPIELVEGDKTFRRTAPLAIQAKVTQNPDWTLQARCGEGPHHRLPTMVDGTPVTPETMALPCSVNLHYADSFNDLTYSVAIEVDGDGTVTPRMAAGAAMLE